jgi:hypothetical protein
MSIGGNKFCDHCGGAIYLHDLTAVKMEQDGHLVQLHFHNRHSTDCLAQRLIELDEKFANESIAA